MRILFLVLCPFWLLAQNLVVNPSFEELISNANILPCTYTKTPQQFTVIKGWSTVSGSTPDVILRSDSLTDCYFPKPHSGTKLIGFINYLQQSGIGDNIGYHDYLVQLGVNDRQISYKGYGETAPKANNDSIEGKQQNRRVECKIIQ